MNNKKKLYNELILEVVKAGPILSRYIIHQIAIEDDFWMDKPYSRSKAKQYWLDEEPNNIPPLVPTNTDLTDDEWFEYLDKILVYDRDHYDNNRIDAHWLTYNTKRKHSEIKSLSLVALKKEFGFEIKTKSGKHPIMLWHNKAYYNCESVIEVYGVVIIFKLRPELEILLDVLML